MCLSPALPGLTCINPRPPCDCTSLTSMTDAPWDSSVSRRYFPCASAAVPDGNESR